VRSVVDPASLFPDGRLAELSPRRFGVIDERRSGMLSEEEVSSMRPLSPRLALIVALAGAALQSSSLCLAQPASLPDSNLARGSFRVAVFDRDETRLLTATAELAQLWDLSTGVLLARYEGHKAPIQCLAFASDERQILTAAGKTTEHGTEDSSVRLWGTSTGKLATVLPARNKKLIDEVGDTFSNHVASARYSPTGRQLLAVLASRNSYPDAAVLWNIEEKDIEFVLPGISTASGTRVLSEPVRFSPNGKILSGLTKKASRIDAWDAKTGDALWSIDSSDPAKQDAAPEDMTLRFVGSAQWSPSGAYLVAAMSDRTIHVWDASTRREITQLRGHSGRIESAEFFLDDTQILSASQDGTVRLWNARSGDELRRWEYSGPVQELSVSPDGKIFLTRVLRSHPSYFRAQWFGELRNRESGETIRRWEQPPMWVAENQPLNAFRSSIMSPSGRLVMTTEWTDGEVRVVLMDAESGAIAKRY
jgi:WD40 repeat protein